MGLLGLSTGNCPLFVESLTVQWFQTNQFLFWGTILNCVTFMEPRVYAKQKSMTMSTVLQHTVLLKIHFEYKLCSLMWSIARYVDDQTLDLVQAQIDCGEIVPVLRDPAGHSFLFPAHSSTARKQWQIGHRTTSQHFKYTGCVTDGFCCWTPAGVWTHQHLREMFF